jgi:hypothetical protein
MCLFSHVCLSETSPCSTCKTSRGHGVESRRNGHHDGLCGCKGLVYNREFSDLERSHRFTVNGFTTTGVPSAGYRLASRKDRARALDGISFDRTRCKDKGKGESTIIPPAHLKGREKYLSNWRIPIGKANQLLLIRNIILDKDGGLCRVARNLAAALKYPHHVGAGGAETKS